MEPVRLEILLDDKTLKGLRSVEGNLGNMGQFAKLVIAQLEQELATLQERFRQAMAAGTNTDAQMADIQALQGVVRQLKTELQGLEEQKKKTGSTPLVKDNPAPKLNNVRMSMQQIARELPSLAMGPQMFFLAISNNIPMFTDALASARKEYEALTDAGKKATPVWKQVLSSLFSWQTAMAALITLSVVYGKEIGGWVKSLFGVKDAALSAAKAQEKVNESFRSSSSDVAEQVTLVRSLSERWKELGDNMADKKQFITENKKEFGKLGVEVGNVNDAENLLVDNTDVFIGAMILRAEAAAAFKLATEQTEKALKKQNEIEERRKKGPTFWDKFRANFFSSASGSATYTRQADAPTAEQLSENAVSALEEEQKAAEDTAKSYTDLFLARTKEWKERLKSAGIKEDDGRETKDTGKSARDYQDELADARIRAQQKLEAARISVMREGIRKRQALARQELDESLAQIDKEERDTLKKMDEAEKKRGVKSTPEERQAVRDNASQQRAMATMGYLKESYDIEKEFRDRNLREWVEYYKEYGTYQEKRAALDKEYNHKIGQLYEERRKAEAEGDAAGVESLDLQIARATKDKGKELIKLDYKQLTESPDYIRAFENLRETSTGTLNSLLEQFEKAKQAAAQVLSPEDLREYTTTIREIMDELDSRNPFQALADRKSELAEAERELAEAQRNLETVNAGGRVSTGVRYNDRTGKMEETYLTAAAAMEKYNKAQDKVARSSSRVEKAEKEAADIVGELARAVGELGGAIGGQAGEIITLMGDVALFTLTTIDSLGKVAQTGVNAISAVEKASVILTIISAAIQLFQKISELGNNRAFRQYEAYAEKIKEINALTDAVNEYRIAALEAQQAESNWFSADNLKNLRDYRALHDEVAKAYADKAMESQAIYRNESGGGWLTGALNWVMGNLSALSWWDEWRDIWGQGDYKEGQTAAINNLRIETRKKSSGFLGTGIGGKSQKTEDLVTWARNQGLGELFDDEGLINKELAQSLIDNYGDKLVGQTKETLEALIELREKYDEYIEQLHEYVSSLYEPLTENFVDGLWDWFDNGKDALDSFKDYASDTFRDIVSDMMRTIVLDKVVGSFGDDIAALYEEYAKGKIDETELMKKVAERTEGLVGDYQSAIPELQNIMDLVGGYLKDAGIDIRQPEGSSQSGRAGTVTSMTEETAGRLEGIGNAALDRIISIDNNLTRHLEGMATSLGKIAGNSEYLRHLETINENIAELRRGVKLKT
ncbi:hypothetical protein IY41_10210 [Phocaeicola dorei]|mgnify:FL=1|jgi:hypothetical protein|uniref:hypothetical protein n=1 Tax=Phocaeicola dorei TaxID=357276 RepID=UPI0006BD77E3|nr:hypothetical protein [Phocaeicola dorei]ALA73788.1 hypothetical protein IY41_10210 [Phocaeicola dorei]